MLMFNMEAKFSAKSVTAGEPAKLQILHVLSEEQEAM